MAFYSTKGSKSFNKFLEENNLVPKEKALDINTKILNINNIVSFFERRYVKYKDLRSFENIKKELLEGFPYSDYFTSNDDNWIRFIDLSLVIYNSHQSFKNLSIYDWEDIGKNMINSNSVRLLKYVALKEGSIKLLQRVEKLNNLQNDYTKLEATKLENRTGIFNFYYDKNCNEVSPGIAPYYFMGVLSIIPQLDKYKKIDTNLFFSQMRLENIIKFLYNHQNFDLKFEDDKIIKNNKIIAKKVKIKDLISKTLFEEIEYFIRETDFQDFLEFDDLNKTEGYIIENDLIRDDKIYLKEGDLFNFPYSKFKLSWTKRDNISKLKSLFFHESTKEIEKYLFEQKEDFLSLVKQLENKVYEDYLSKYYTDKKLEEIRGLFHNLNNRISVISGITEIFLKKEERGTIKLDDTSKVLLNNLKEESSWLIETVRRGYNRIKDLSDNSYEKININNIVEKELEFLSLKKELSDIQFEYVPQKYTPDITANKTDLILTTNELITNAIKALKYNSSKKIEIQTYSKDNYVVLEVKDNGKGIAESDLYELFSGKKIDKNRKGDNLGLKELKKIAEQYNGFIEVESEKDLGTTFRVYFNYSNN